MPDPLSYLWTHIEGDEPVFGEMTVCHHWKDDAFERLRQVGILQRVEDADYVICPDCEEQHVETIIPWRTADGELRLGISCHQNGRVDIRPEWLRRWSVSFNRLVHLLAAGLGLDNPATLLEPNRVWRLGAVPWQGGRREVLFARGFSSLRCDTPPPDLSGHPMAIVLVPHEDPSTVDWGKHVPIAIPLPHVAKLADESIEFDLVAMMSVVAEADEVAVQRATNTLSVRQFKTMVGREVKTVQQCELPDAILVRAYIQEGSYRRAAQFLTRETGQEVSKDAVVRAVRRAGGRSEVVRDADSQSVVRNVASARRNRSGKRLNLPKESK